MRLEPDFDEVEAILREVEVSSGRFVGTVVALGASGIDEPSSLDGWSRRMVAAHVGFVAEAYRRMSDEALIVGQSAAYRGGALERIESLNTFEGLPHARLCVRLRCTSDALIERWRDLDPDAWSTTFDDRKLGTISIARLVALRLTELEVHRGDLTGVDGPHEWSSTFVRVCLPLRIAWLPGHHHRRDAADRSVRGRWLLRSEDQAWLVVAEGSHVESTVAGNGAEADVTIGGSAPDLLAFLLGRVPSVPLSISGELAVADQFKLAFPGP